MKVSFAVTLLLRNVSAQDAVVEDAAMASYNTTTSYNSTTSYNNSTSAYNNSTYPDVGRMASNSTYAAQEVDRDLRGPARDIVRAIDDLQRQIPQGDVSGKIGYTVNTAPFRAGLD